MLRKMLRRKSGRVDLHKTGKLESKLPADGGVQEETQLDCLLQKDWFLFTEMKNRGLSA